MGNVNGITSISSATCGNLLVDIANKNFTSNKSIFEESNHSSYLTPLNTNTDLLNPFNFNAFQQVDSNNPYSMYFNPNGLDIGYDLIEATSHNPYGNAAVTKRTPVKTGAKPHSSSHTQQAPASNSSGVMGFLSDTWDSIKTGASNIWNGFKRLLGNLIDYAYSWIGKINNDAQGNRRFSNGKSQAWCADFVTYCVKKVMGDKLPSDFGSSAVSGLRDWGNAHNCYSSVPQPKTVAVMRNYLKNNVKPGDIMIQKDGGRSHTGIVKSVAPDGSSYVVVEGNSSDKVQTVTYHVNKPSDPGIKYISGFVSLAQYA